MFPAEADLLYPMGVDAPGRPRTFQCRQGLWDSFAQMSEDIGVPLAELIEEAMTSYAQARGRLDAPPDLRRKPSSKEETHDRVAVPAGGMPAPEVLDDSDSAPAMPGRQGAPRRLAPPTPPPGTLRMPNRPARPPQPVAAGRTAAMPAPTPLSAPPPRSSSRSATTMPAPTPGRPVPLPLPAPPMSTLKSARSSAPSLTLTYLERPHVVDKDRYVLGRSKTGADLHLDDSNVSRQHAMIERTDPTWFVVDLGSTNGVFVGGERVARRALRDGDIIEITTHQIRVTLT